MCLNFKLYRKVGKFRRCGSLTEPSTYRSCCRGRCHKFQIVQTTVEFRRYGSLTEPSTYCCVAEADATNFKLYRKLWKFRRCGSSTEPPMYQSCCRPCSHRATTGANNSKSLTTLEAPQFQLFDRFVGASAALRKRAIAVRKNRICILISTSKCRRQLRSP